MQRAYLLSTRVLNVLLVGVGIAMVVTSVARGGGVAALGTVLGVLFVLLGAGRIWLLRDRDA